MFEDSPQNLLYLVGGAFLTGWLVGKIGAFFGRKLQPARRDPRDDRIRSMEADLRVARNDLGKTKSEVEDKLKSLKEAESAAKGLQKTIDEQAAKIEALHRDLKDSVQKTRELRAELSDRATENLKSEVKLREMETELSVIQASSDMMATGVLDYSVNDDEDEGPARASTPAS